MKPDWSTAPSWANYLAMDEDGEWYWYEKKPIKHWLCWGSKGQEMSAGKSLSWEETLEKRP